MHFHRQARLKMPKTPAYHRKIVAEMLADDGLCILGRGMGIDRVLYHLVRRFATPRSLVFIMNVEDDTVRYINNRLFSSDGDADDDTITSNSYANDEDGDARMYDHGATTSSTTSSSSSSSASSSSSSSSSSQLLLRLLPLRVIANETSQAMRQKLYLGGGCISVTTRILTTDLLTKTIPIDLVSGIIVNAAEVGSVHACMCGVSFVAIVLMGACKFHAN